MMAAAIAAMTLGELLGPAAGLHSSLVISDLALDDRQVTAGAAFLAVQGGRSHGLQYAKRARAQGAVVVIYEPSADYPAVESPAVRERFKGIGVTIPAADRRSPEYLTKFVASEIERWAGPIKASGVSED